MIYSERIQTSQAIYESLDITVGGFGHWSCNDEIDTIFDMHRILNQQLLDGFQDRSTIVPEIKKRTCIFCLVRFRSNIFFQVLLSWRWWEWDWNLRSRADLNTHSILTDTKKDVFFSYHQDLWNNMNQLRIEKISFISTFRDSQSPEFGGSQFVFWEATKKGKELQRTKWPVPPPWMLLSRSSRRCCWAQGMVRYERIPWHFSGEVGRSHCQMG